MSKEILLEWDKPLVLAELEREQRKDEPRQSGLRILVISLVLHALAICIAWIVTKEIWTNEDRIKLGLSLAALSLAMPLWNYVIARESLKTERHYEIREDGILCARCDDKTLYRWHRIDNYQIEPNPVLPQLRILRITGESKWSPVKCKIDFDPAQIPEDNIRALLDARIKP